MRRRIQKRFGRELFTSLGRLKNAMTYGMYVDTILGKLYLAEEEDCLVRLDGGQATLVDCLQETAFLRNAAEQVQEYLVGKRRSFDLPIRTHGTAFQEKVWRALCNIPYGETRTYGEIAKAVGCPGGYRAVGGACNRNPVMLVVPCHRVIGGNGKLVGFGGGLPMKEALLTLEGIIV